MATLLNTTINDTGFLQLPTGTTGQRPSSPVDGMVRFNTTLDIVEYYNASYTSWLPISLSPPVATGGTVDNSSVPGYRIHAFTSTGNSTFTVTKGGPIEYLVVAGGGAGGGGDVGGGGGGGGVVYRKAIINTGSYTVTVGSGGTGIATSSNWGNNGNDSSFYDTIAIGGGGGAGWGTQSPGRGGGSGGGGTNAGDHSFGIPGQGHSGTRGVASPNYPQGGGGGAGGVAEIDIGHYKGGDGGPGVFYGNYFSTAYGQNGFFGGGGGGAVESNQNPNTPTGRGGIGGGGRGGRQTNNLDTGAGQANTGGGGGGDDPGAGGTGGSGVVLIRYQIS